MQAILLATSEANHLHPLTEYMPSPMLPLANRPVMVYAIELLARQGFKQIFISLHTLAGEIEAYFGTGQRWGVHLRYILQRDAWGTAGALRWAKNALTEPFLAMPADALIDLDLAAVIEHHEARRPLATVVVHRLCNQIARPLRLSSDGWIQQGNSSEPGQETWCDTGAYIFEPEALDLIPARTPYEIHSQLIPAMLEAGQRVSAYPMSGYWNPLDTFSKYQAAQRVYLYSAWGNKIAQLEEPCIRFPRIEGRQIAPGIWVGRNQVIHPAARLAPPICIGQNCQIGQGAELGPEAVIGDHVMVDDEATILCSTILSHTYVGQLVHLENRLVDKNLVIDVESAQNLRVPDPFLLSSTLTIGIESGLSRLANRAIALLLLLVLLPLLLPLCLLVWIGEGQVFHTLPRRKRSMQIREGNISSDSAEFGMIRFRTRRGDGSQTRLGRWLERWEIHRLPELWNVARGEMDLIGVRPLSADEVDRLSESWQHRRNEGAPGFTGLWYVQTCRDGSLDEMLMADVFYLATRTWRKDLLLLLQTPQAWLRRVKDFREKMSSGKWSEDGTYIS